MWCVWKKRYMISWNWKNDIHMIRPLKWSSSPLKLKNQDLHGLFQETLCWINLCLAKKKKKKKNHSNYKYLALLHCMCHFCRTALVDKFSTQEVPKLEKKNQQMWKKSKIWNIKSWLVPLSLSRAYMYKLYQMNIEKKICDTVARMVEYNNCMPM